MTQGYEITGAFGCHDRCDTCNAEHIAFFCATGCDDGECFWFHAYDATSHRNAMCFSFCAHINHMGLSAFIEVRQALQELVTRDEVMLEPWRADDFTIFAIDRVINKQTAEFRFLFASDVDNFTEFPQGFVLAEDGDRQYRVEKPREAVVFPNANVAIGQRTMLLVVPTRLWE